MIEADVWRALLAVLRTGLDANGLTDVTVHQANQPIKQGASSGRSIYLHKIRTIRIGHQGRKHAYNSGNDNFDVIEKSWRGPVFQLMSSVTQNICEEDSLTAYDVADTCSMIMQSIATIKQLKTYGLSTEIIRDINQSFPLDDKDQFDLDPTSDFVLLYEQTLISQAPKIDDFDDDIKRI